MAVTLERRGLPVLAEPASGLTVMTGVVDRILEWGVTSSLWVFPMGTSCCAIELMAAAASRVDLDRMGTIVRASPRQADVMVVAGTITTKMAPRVLALWEQMPEPKWCIAMGSCAISGDFYRNLYSVVPGVDTVLPVDVYVPGCPPNPEALMHGLLRLKEKVLLAREGKVVMSDRELRPAQVEAALRATSLELTDEHDRVYAPELPAVAASPERHGDLGVVEAAAHVETARQLRAQGFAQLVYVAATHYAAKTGAKPSPERIEVSYALRTVGKGTRLASWRVVLAPGEEVPTLVGVFAGADWQEREQFDLLGVRFAGHPDMRRIMTADTFQGHPLRKEFPSDKECPPWR